MKTTKIVRRKTKVRNGEMVIVTEIRRFMVRVGDRRRLPVMIFGLVNAPLISFIKIKTIYDHTRVSLTTFYDFYTNYLHGLSYCLFNVSAITNEIFARSCYDYHKYVA